MFGQGLDRFEYLGVETAVHYKAIQQLANKNSQPLHLDPMELFIQRFFLHCTVISSFVLSCRYCTCRWWTLNICIALHCIGAVLVLLSQHLCFFLHN